MSIRPPLWSRLIFALGGTAASVLLLFITFMGMFVHDGGPVTGFFGVVLGAAFAGVAYWAGRSTGCN